MQSFEAVFANMQICLVDTENVFFNQLKTSFQPPLDVHPEPATSAKGQLVIVMDKGTRFTAFAGAEFSAQQVVAFLETAELAYFRSNQGDIDKLGTSEGV
jgi:hypothetical protein